MVLLPALTAAISFMLHLDKHMSAMIQQHGTATYAILWTIVFCETGLVLTPFLPGDSLLFAAGAFAGETVCVAARPEPKLLQDLSLSFLWLGQGVLTQLPPALTVPPASAAVLRVLCCVNRHGAAQHLAAVCSVLDVSSAG